MFLEENKNWPFQDIKRVDEVMLPFNYITGLHAFVSQLRNFEEQWN
jgi:hypothetical protein